LPNAAPVDRGAVRTEADALLGLADRVSDLSRPIAPRGVLLLKELLVDADGPLYLGSLDCLEAALVTVAAALEEGP
jgi:hypothetical protein